jgi:hypothetical protein
MGYPPDQQNEGEVLRSFTRKARANIPFIIDFQGFSAIPFTNNYVFMVICVYQILSTFKLFLRRA